MEPVMLSLGIPEILYILVCWLLFPLGGADDWALGSRYWRRAGIPVATAIYLGLTWWTALIALALFGALTMGYGSSKPYWYKLAVGALWAVPSMFVGWTLAQFFLPAAWIFMFVLSNTHKEWIKNFFVWKVVEFTTGAMIALTFICAVK